MFHPLSPSFHSYTSPFPPLFSRTAPSAALLSSPWPLSHKLASCRATKQYPKAMRHTQ